MDIVYKVCHAGNDDIKKNRTRYVTALPALSS